MNTAIVAKCLVTEGASGWLAVAADPRLGIGVVGESREEAEARFRAAVERRTKLLSEDER